MLVHICRGQPARAPELPSIRYCNTHAGYRRNIFLEAGQVGLVIAYHKGYSFEGSSKIIHRYLPQEVGALLVYYLWLLRPFQEQVEVSHYHKLSTHGYLWGSGVEDAKWTSDRVRRLNQGECGIGIDQEVNISSCRNRYFQEKFLACHI